MRRLTVVSAVVLMVAFTGTAHAQVLERLAVGCRSTSVMNEVVDAFARDAGPDRLNELVRTKQCRWLEAGTLYALTKAKPTDIARQIRLQQDGAIVWVPIGLLARDGDSAAMPLPATPPEAPVDGKTALSMATMQAIISYAKENCPGNADPNAEAAVALVARQKPEVFAHMIRTVRTAVDQQAAKVGVAEQCRNIVAAYGPRGSVNAGAWVPARR